MIISVIITTYKEPETLPKAISSILSQISEGKKMEIIVVGPDEQTKSVVQKFSSRYSFVKYVQDRGEGKPAAINLALIEAKGDIIISTDGDVIIGSQSIEKLLFSFQNSKVGAVSGHPVSTNLRNTILGYWASFLTNAAHQMRTKKDIWPCSGYLYAFRNIIKNIPPNVLSEDGFITQIIRQEGYLIKYAPQAKVYAKYPNNFKDWFKQKVRSAGGYVQISKIRNMRNITQEIKDGMTLFFVYPKSIKEFFWTILLYLARIYLWLLIFWKIQIKKEKFKAIWKRIESTK